MKTSTPRTLLTARPLLWLIGTLLIFFGSIENCWALQSHGAPEGIYVHQMAHLLFCGALGYLYWHTRKTPVINSRGWKYLQIFCIFFIAWNLLAFAGHQIFSSLRPEDFIDKGTWREQLSPPINYIKAAYYISKMDHFLNVPAFLALTISLKIFYEEVQQQEEHDR